MTDHDDRVLVLASDLDYAEEVLADVDRDRWRFVSMPQHIDGAGAHTRFLLLNRPDISVGRFHLIRALRDLGATEVDLLELPTRPIGATT